MDSGLRQNDTRGEERMEETEVENQLWPYQKEVFDAICDSAYFRKGLTFSVEIARQGGKNEISARVESFLLPLHMDEPVNLIKCSPTFQPQSIISILRLKEKLNYFGFEKKWTSELGYIIRLGAARAIFLSADESANVVGNTAHLLLEIDEAQDVGKEKYSKEFKPMGATTNVTTVLYGTTWDDTTLLEEVKQTNLELERRDGLKRHFRYDWEEVAKYNPDYRQYVERERERLGDNHPLFLTQYRLLPIHGGGGFLSATQREQLQGEHERMRRGEEGKLYVAGIDLAGEAEEVEGEYLVRPNIKRDATVVTIGELDFADGDEVNKEPKIRIVEHYRWVGKKHTELYGQLVDILKNVWRCKRIVVDATGVGEPVASFLRKALGSRVTPFKFTQQSKSELGFNLLASINSGRLKIYKGDGSEEYQEFWGEMEKARSQYRPNQTMSFYVEPGQGHDDFLMSLALVSEAGRLYEKRGASGSGE
jgi:hypothetical protein